MISSKKTKSPFNCRYQTTIVPQIVMRFLYPRSLYMMGFFFCLQSVQIFSIPVGSYVHLPRCVWKMLFPWSYQPCLVLQSFAPFYSSKIPELCGEGCDIHIPLRSKHSTVFRSLHIDQLWVSVLSSIVRKSLSYDDLEMLWSMSTAISHQKSF